MPKKKIRVNKPNNLIELKASLTPAGCDVLDILFAMMDGNESETSFLIDTKEYDGFFINHKGEKMSHKRIYERIQNGAEDLINTTITIGSSKKGAEFNVLSSRAWNDGKGMLQINLTNEFSTLLKKEHEKNEFTLYDLRYMFALKTVHAKRLYPMLARWVHTGKRIDNADELKEKLGISPNFRQDKFIKIIEGALVEINANTDLAIKMQLKQKAISGGKRLEGFQFAIKQQAKKALPGLTKDQMQIIESVKDLSEKFTQTEAERISDAAEYDLEKIKKAYEVMEHYSGEIDDTTAFMIAAINGGWENGANRNKKKSAKGQQIETRKYDYDALEKQFEEQLMANRMLKSEESGQMVMDLISEA